MTVLIVTVPNGGASLRAVVEGAIEQLIALLDGHDAGTDDREPEIEEDSDDGEVEIWPEWHTRSAAL